MKNRTTLISLMLALLSLAFFVSGAVAQEQSNAPINPTDPSSVPDEVYNTPSFPESIPKPDGLSSCFDVYKFGSVQASVTPSLSQVYQGSAIAFTGTLNNQNNYPIIDATVYVKIFHDRTNGEKNINGPDVVDWFPAVENINLKSSEEKAISFEWDVPYDADPGSYMVATYVASSSQFELSGLTFTDDVTGTTEPFEVIGSTKGVTHFDKTSVTVNNAPFYFAAFPPKVSDSARTVNVSAKIINTSSVFYEGALTWDLYYWDQLQDNRLITSKKEDIRLEAGKDMIVSFSTDDTSHTVYYLVGTITSKTSGAKSIAGIRFIRDNVAEPRINFMGVNKYPISKGSTAVVCIHSTSNTMAQKSKVELSIIPIGFMNKLFGGTIHKNYTGIIPGDIYALAAPIAKDLDSFDLNAKLYNDQGALINDVTIPYRCSDLGAACKKFNFASIIAVLLLIIIVASLIVVSIIIIKRKY